MKKIINGKKYDTGTAEFVAWFDNGCGYNDLNYYSEELYRKRTGEFFLFKDGGANSCMARRYGENSWGGSSEIVPVSVDEAKKFAEEHGEVDKYEKIFGEVKE